MTHEALYDEENQLHGLFFTYPWCESMAKKNSCILIMDCTYKSNRFGMPLLQVIGVMELNTRFPICWAFINTENDESYYWAINYVRELIQRGSNIIPFVIITDNEAALKNMLTELFPTTQQQLYEWHEKNLINAKARTVWKDTTEDDDREAEFMTDYTAMQQSHRSREFCERLSDLKDKYAD
jgi:transposase-like protein